MLAKLKALASRGRALLTVVAGIAAELVASGLAHGAALHIAQAVIALATVAGTHVASTSFAAKAVADAQAAVKAVGTVKADVKASDPAPAVVTPAGVTDAPKVP